MDSSQPDTVSGCRRPSVLIGSSQSLPSPGLRSRHTIAPAGLGAIRHLESRGDQLPANGAGGDGCCSFGTVQTWPQHRQRMYQTEASRDEWRNAVTPSASQWGQSWTLVELRGMMSSLFSRVVKAARHAPRRSRAGSCQKAIERIDITELCPSDLFDLEHMVNTLRRELARKVRV
jgi:hypothetical protein